MVRLGKKKVDRPAIQGHPQPFTCVPYDVKLGARGCKESSARSRGFKFAMVSGIAAFLAKANIVFVPESGQGALGPVLLPVGQAYPDYRNHPLFTRRMERLLDALLGHSVRYEFPRLWFTKGETLQAYVALDPPGDAWRDTVSCWQQNRHSSVEGKFRQCGICAACLLRRQSIHAAKLVEGPSAYVWEDLGAETFEQGAARSFEPRRITAALREYAIAGVLHLDQLASLRHSRVGALVLRRQVFELSRSLGQSGVEVSEAIDGVLHRHEAEWRSFLNLAGKQSFMTNWAKAA